MLKMPHSLLIPGTIWITGLSASGKTTLGKSLYGHLVQRFPETYVKFLDGEELRKHLSREYGYSTEERFEVVKKIVQIASQYKEKCGIVIVSTISHKKHMREFARSQLPHFMEVYLKCPTSVCTQRDYKDHYRRAFAGEYEMFVGVTDLYEASENPELTIDTAKKSIGKCTEVLIQQAITFLGLKL